MKTDRAVVAADAAQPADDVGDVAAEHAPVVVQLVDHDVPQVLEQLDHLVWWAASRCGACPGW